MPLSAAAKIVRHGLLLCGIFTQCGIFAFRTAQRQPADGGVTPENATPNAKPSSQRRDAA
ncbi:MAG TPA: hypothetical protein VN890_07175 [Methylocella sp.]|nr:hypothetical protein [Methylocella sp.]